MKGYLEHPQVDERLMLVSNERFTLVFDETHNSGLEKQTKAEGNHY